jgi:hypothetical protein
MDFGKIPVDKVAFFIAGIIPGGAATYIYWLANPQVFQGYLATDAFGYRTKLGIAVAISFVVGNTITLFIFALGGAIRGGIAGAMSALPSRKPPEMPQSVPWREPRWRKLAKKYLEESAPPDTLPLSAKEFKSRSDELSLLPQAERDAKQSELDSLCATLAMDDSEWNRWYAQFADQLTAEKSSEFTTIFAWGLRANLQTTGIYLFVSMFFVPSLRYWYVSIFSVGWILLLFAETYKNYVDYSNPWTTWFEQMEFLAGKTLRQVKPDNGEQEISAD